MDFFKFNGFSVGEYYSGNADGFNWGLAPVMLKELLTDDEMKATEGIMREFVVLGLFALDKDDVVFIAYRKEINKMSPLRQNEMSKEGIE